MPSPLPPQDPANVVVIFSGSETHKLEEIFGDLPVWLAAENGVFVRPPPQHTGTGSGSAPQGSPQQGGKQEGQEQGQQQQQGGAQVGCACALPLRTACLVLWPDVMCC